MISKADEGSPRLSPDGRWLAYESDESGRTQVYVQSFPEATERVQVSVDGGYGPNWSPDGRALYFVREPALMMAAVKPGQEFSTSKPTPLLEGRTVVLDYDIAPDGRILILRRNPDAAPRKFQVVLNWFAELRKRVGE